MEIKNYRCFPDSHPLRIKIENGFMSFVGKNNSGKSSILKIFYELRNLWRDLSNETHFRQVLATRAFNIGYMREIDPVALFNVDNERDLTIELIINDEMIDYDNGVENCRHIKKLTLSISRIIPSHIRINMIDNHGVNVPNISPSTATHAGSNILIYTVQGAQSYYTCDHVTKLFDALNNVVYIGPFRNAINQGQGDYFDLKVGSSFIEQWDYWKNGRERSKNRSIQRVISDIRHIFEYRNLDINASPDNKTLKINANDIPHEMDELGSGLSQFIIVFGNAAILSPSIILIDEPELHLHPSLQIDFITSLAKYSKYGVMFATHSLGLARSVSDTIFSCQTTPTGSKATIIDDSNNYVEFLGEMSFSAYKDMGYESILLVEGVHEVKTFQQFLRKMRKDHKVVILPLGGDQLAKGGVESELSEIGRLSNSVYAIVDSEKTSESASPIEARMRFKAICDKLGFNAVLTDLRAIENYFTDEAIKAELGEKYRSLHPYELLKEAPNHWGKGMNWKIASHMSIDDISGTDIGRLLEAIN